MDDIWKIRWFWICWAVSWPRESLNSVFGLFYCVMCRNNKLSAIWNRERSTSANIWKSLPLIRAATALAPCVPTTVIWNWKFRSEIVIENKDLVWSVKSPADVIRYEKVYSKKTQVIKWKKSYHFISYQLSGELS